MADNHSEREQGERQEMNTVSMVLLVFGGVVSVVGALFTLFAYLLFAGGDCNPCGQPPLWV